MSKKSRREHRNQRGSQEDRVLIREHYGTPRGKPKDSTRKRLPMNMREVRELLSSKGTHKYLRLPIGTKENRYWDKLWQFKGRPYNKSPYKGDSKKRKQRQEKQSKRWRKKREQNNKKKV